MENKRASFEAWLGFSPMKMDDGSYADPDVCVDWLVWQSALASPEVQALRDALWTCAEHNTLHFGELHSTVTQARAALAAMEKQKC